MQPRITIIKPCELDDATVLMIKNSIKTKAFVPGKVYTMSGLRLMIPYKKLIISDILLVQLPMISSYIIVKYKYHNRCSKIFKDYIKGLEENIQNEKRVLKFSMSYANKQLKALRNASKKT